MKDDEEILIHAEGPVRGTVRVPSSKSLTHRALVLSALGHGRSRIAAPLLADDTTRTARALAALGIRFEPFGPGAGAIAQAFGPEETTATSAAGRPGSLLHGVVPPRGSGEDVVTVQPGSDSGLWVEGGSGALRAAAHPIRLGGAGTAMRFLTALAALADGEVVLDGDARMRERPIEPLLEALRSWGVDATSVNGNGCPPVRVHGTGRLRGGHATLQGDVSSQFVSALLMIAPLALGETTLEVLPPVVSRPYIDLTLDLMAVFGAPRPDFEERSGPSISAPGRPGGGHGDGGGPRTGRVASRDGSGRNASQKRGLMPPESLAKHGDHQGPGDLTVTRGGVVRFRGGAAYACADYVVPPDASAASYFLAAPAIAGGCVTVLGLRPDDPQGDMVILEALEAMGCTIAFVNGNDDEGGVTVEGPAPSGRIAGASGYGRLRSYDLDLGATPDLVPTLAVLALFADGPSEIRNVAHLRIKESDRLRALATELRRLGANIHERDDGLRIEPAPLHGERIETYRDHRIAMALALVGLAIPGVRISDPDCVDKSFPGFWTALASLARGADHPR